MLINQTTLQNRATMLWDTYCESFPALVKFDCPKIIINNRYTKCAGCNVSSDNIVQLGGKFLVKFPDNMIEVILPHELAHQIDYNLNGWYDRKPHHGKAWITIMNTIGQNPEPYHTMVL